MEKILIIDDDRFSQSLIQQALYKSYETRTADDGRRGIALAQKWQPNVILLDVDMPNQSGYEVCDLLKHNGDTSEIPIVFLSNKASVRDWMLGFEVGADDYLIKPCDEDLLQARLQKITHQHRERQTLKQDVISAEKTALEAMATSFELGKAVRFVERSYNISNYNRLGNELIEVLNGLHLHSCVMIKHRFGVEFFGTVEVKPIERDLMTMLHTEQRFKDFGCRTQINYPQIALLIKNMPIEDRSRYGRIKDTMPFVLGAADAKVRVLDAELALREQNQELATSVKNVQFTLAEVSNILIKNQRAVGEIMMELTGELSLHMSSMGLDGDQEEFINSKVDRAANRLHSCIREGNVVEAIMSGIVDLLHNMTNEQARIIEETLAANSADDDNNPGSQDIELF